MNGVERESSHLRSWCEDRLLLGRSWKEYLRGLITPLNTIALAVVLAGLPLIVMRYFLGLGSIVNASHDQPWGVFLAWGLFSGVPLASTGFIMATAVYLFGMKQYHALLRPAVLTGFIGYFFAVIFLLIDLGAPWRLPYPLLVSFGTGSVMFLVAWHVALYLSTQFVEFCPAIFEWLGADRLRRWALRVTIGATIFGVVLSTLHQSALGALFLLAPAKMHPLWYSPYLPLFFFVSSIYAGLSMIIVESTLVSRFLTHRVDPATLTRLDRLSLGLGKGAAVVLFAYFGIKLIGLAHGNHWDMLGSGYGLWFAVEMIFLILLPCFLFTKAVREERPALVRFTALYSILGVIVNRFTVSLIAFNWQLPEREFVNAKELVVVLAVVTIELLVYRAIVNRLPVHCTHPDYANQHGP